MANIILLNGTSSAGKSTIAKNLQQIINEPFWHFSSDQLVEAGMLPKRKKDGGLFDWSRNRPLFFDGFHGCIKALAGAGNNLIVDHLIESEDWFMSLVTDLSAHDVFYVGVHCPLSILREREIQRGDRYIGEAEYHLKKVHSYGKYDFEIDGSKQLAIDSAKLILSAWLERSNLYFSGALAG